MTAHTGKDFYYDHLPVYSGGNVYFNGAQPYDGERDFCQVSDAAVNFELKEADGRIYFDTDLYDHMPDMDTILVTTGYLGRLLNRSRSLKLPMEHRLFLIQIIVEEKRKMIPLPGPFAGSVKSIDIFRKI